MAHQKLHLSIQDHRTTTYVNKSVLTNTKISKTELIHNLYLRLTKTCTLGNLTILLLENMKNEFNICVSHHSDKH